MQQAKYTLGELAQAFLLYITGRFYERRFMRRFCWAENYAVINVQGGLPDEQGD